MGPPGLPGTAVSIDQFFKRKHIVFCCACDRDLLVQQVFQAVQVQLAFLAVK